MIVQDLVISIHAPTRGATLVASDAINSISGDFNPRSHKGSDCSLSRANSFITAFQSTLPQGERPVKSSW